MQKDTGGSARSRPIPSTIRPSDGSPLDRRPPRAGYVELPYTLPQDSTLFLLMRYQTSDLWRTKVEWLVSKGGMVLVNVHPDYIDFGDGRTPTPNFSASIYRDFLRHIREVYDKRFWHGTARELSRWYVGRHCGIAGANAPAGK